MQNIGPDSPVIHNELDSLAVTQNAAAKSAPPLMTRRIAILFAIACGLAVSNVYYAQPLLDSLAYEFGISHSSLGIVITVTQICYALGLFLLVPLGDLLNQRRLIVIMMLLSVAALVIIGTAPAVPVLFIGLAIMGLLAVVTQVLVSFASTLAAPSERGSVVGFVTSGVVIGILLARTIAGVLTDLAGWRSVYLTSAALMLIIVGAIYRVMLQPNRLEKNSLSYPQLLHSVLQLFVEERILRIRAILAMLIFTAFSTLWTSLVLPLSSPPYSLSHTAIGAFGLAGVAGALAASRAGRLADRGWGQRTTGVALFLLTVSWLPINDLKHSLIFLIIGVVLLDAAVQAVHVTNQSLIFNVRPEARSRLTAAYMIFYSIGSATGSIASTKLYAYAGWNAVCLFGAAISSIAFIFWALTRRLA